MQCPFSCGYRHLKTAAVVAVLFILVQYLGNIVVYRKFNNLLITLQRQLGNHTYNASRTMQQEGTLPLCPVISPRLKGRTPVNIEIASWAYMEETNPMLSPGGRYKPLNCTARSRVAIIIPYRNRDLHLKAFLQNIHPFLRRQQLDYGIFVIELVPDVTFNRAMLMNIGFVEALKLYDYQCFIFHDVDLIPEDDRNLYTCPELPRHMSVAIDVMEYKLPYPQIFGGVSALTREHFEKINGYSNVFFGWGGEDDDMYRRVLYSNLTVARYSNQVARYKMMNHHRDSKVNPSRFGLLKTTKVRQHSDGLNSLKYRRLKLELRKLYTWVLVTVNQSEILGNETLHHVGFHMTEERMVFDRVVENGTTVLKEVPLKLHELGRPVRVNWATGGITIPPFIPRKVKKRRRPKKQKARGGSAEHAWKDTPPHRVMQQAGPKMVNQTASVARS